MAGRLTTMDQGLTQLMPAVEARSGGLFRVIGAASFLLVLISTFGWVGAIAIKDATGIAGGVVFLVIFGAVLVVSMIAARNVRLFATPDVIGIVGPLGGVRTLPRADFAEVRYVGYRNQILGFPRFPTLHFRRRDGVEAFSTSAYLYRRSGLRELADYLGVPLDLRRPTTQLT